MQILVKEIYIVEGKEFRDRKEAERYLKRLRLQKVYPMSNAKARKIQEYIERELRIGDYDIFS